MGWLYFVCLIFIASPSALAAESRDLAQEIEDPTAPLPTITFKYDYTSELWKQAGNRQAYGLAIANPFYIWGRPNILGVSLSYLSGKGTGPAQILNLTVFDRPWGRFGVGLNASLGQPRQAAESLQMGPAVGFVTRVDRCNMGLLNLNYLSERVSVSALQVIGSCSVGKAWSISTGDLWVVYDWRANQLIEVPLSLQVGKVVRLFDQAFKIFINPRYNIQDTAGTGRWSVALGITLVADPVNHLKGDL